MKQKNEVLYYSVDQIKVRNENVFLQENSCLPLNRAKQIELEEEKKVLVNSFLLENKIKNIEMAMEAIDVIKNQMLLQPIEAIMAQTKILKMQKMIEILH